MSARLSRWRRTLGGRGRRLPAWVWDAATDLARMEGVGPVVRRLRLNPDLLGRRLAERGERSAAQRRANPAFVEVGSLAASHKPSECVVEVMNASGTRLTIRVADPRQLDFAGLSAAFLGDGR